MRRQRGNKYFPIRSELNSISRKNDNGDKKIHIQDLSLIKEVEHLKEYLRSKV